MSEATTGQARLRQDGVDSAEVFHALPVQLDLNREAHRFPFLNIPLTECIVLYWLKH